jgi:hypothetical protein
MARHAAISARQRKVPHKAALGEILEERAVSSRNRINIRGVKRKMSNCRPRPRERQRTRRIGAARRIRTAK